MDAPFWRLVAERAGLGFALELFEEDVAAAAAGAAATSGGLAALDDARAEPWPPMQVWRPA